MLSGVVIEIAFYLPQALKLVKPALLLMKDMHKHVAVVDDLSLIHICGKSISTREMSDLILAELK